MSELPPPPSKDGIDENRSITNVGIAEEMRNSFRDYSMSVIIGRALPDVRDGLKPVHRRILYAMFSEGLLSSKRFSKCAGVVGEVLKKYHPHGDQPVYDALVRMAQPWNMRELLIDGQGNFGSVDGDPPAAYRYTEARLAKIAEELLQDIKENTVDFVPNFDGNVEEPVVLPARFPNLLVNGSEGIAVAMATKCPPHNLGEVIDGCLAIIDSEYNEGPEVTSQLLFSLIPGPDFPTGGFICGRDGCFDLLSTGRGSVVMRGKSRIEDNGKRESIIIEEIPYQVNKARLLERIAELVRDKRVEGISDLRDESDRDGMRIVVEIKRDASADVVINQLYQHTPLQCNYPANLLAIVNGQPKTLTILEILHEFLSFRREVVTRRSRFRLNQSSQKFHLLAGIVTALDDIDRVIDIVRGSPNAEEARQQLQREKFHGAIKIPLFSDSPTAQIAQWQKDGFAQLDAEQAAGILEMRLSRLVALEREKLIAECSELLVTMADLRSILGDVHVLMGVIKNELLEIKEKFASPRRTLITGTANDLTVEDLIDEEEVLVTISHQGYIKRCSLSFYRAQKRGGKGKQAAQARSEDFITDAFVASTHAYLLAFTNLGKVYWVKVHKVPDAGSQSKGRPIINLIQLAEGEKVRAILPVREFPKEEMQQFVVTCTKKGKIKKTDLLAYSNPRNNGLIACGIEEGDELVNVSITNGTNDIFITTRDGMAIRFGEDEARPLGRQAAGVRAISLREGDEVVSMEVPAEGTAILTVTEFGFGKRTAVDQYRKQSRAGQGTKTIKIDSRNGRVADAIQSREDDGVMIVTNKGKLIRVQVADVSELGRATKGVRLINLERGGDEKVVSVTRLVEDGKEEEVIAEGGDDPLAPRGED